MKPTANLRLRRALQAAGLTFNDVAHETKTNLKTVQRWVYEGRTPRRHRAERVAELLGVEPFWLWRDLIGNRTWDRNGKRDSCQVYSRASVLPSSFFRQVLLSATQELWVLTDSEWLLSQLEVPRRVPLAVNAEAGPFRRYLLPPSFIRMYSPDVPGVEIRRHHGTVETSIVRADDTMILIPGGVGTVTASCPALFLSRDTDDGPFDRFAEGFATLWQAAATATP